MIENQKVTTSHLTRKAYLYVRQSTIKQFIENKESTKRQYALKQQAIKLGWSDDLINTIDNDIGESGASRDRIGFKTLVAEVSLGKVGIVMGLEVSRLARNSTDWHRLLEICALTKTLILDEEGIYNPAHFNDRLLLGLKGTMSEAELHVIRARLTGGMINKAKRGELKTRLPIGYVHDSEGRIAMDPNKRIHDSIKLLFKTFRKAGTAHSTVVDFNKQGLSFPKKIFSGAEKGKIAFSKLTTSRVFQVLKNPRYAGVYAYGIRKKEYNATTKKQMIRYSQKDNWISFIKDAHQGYIKWEDYEENIQRLSDNATCNSKTRKSVPREGPALLQGLAICGICGSKMTVRYHVRRNKSLSPDYHCKSVGKEYAPRYCQTISGDGIEETIEKIIIDKMTPTSFELALSINEELNKRIEDADKLRYKKVEQAHYEKELSRRRYMGVDPDNRLVADELETEWNLKIKKYNEIKNEYKEKKNQDQLKISNEMKKQILELSLNFKQLWNSENTSYKDRKRIIKLIIEDVTLIKKEEIKLLIRFKGGKTEEYTLPLPKSSWEERKHDPKIIEMINKLLKHKTDGEVAEELNNLGYLSGTGKNFDARRISKIRRAYNLKSYYWHLKKKGLYTIAEICDKYNVKRWTVYEWKKSGKLKGYRYDDCGRYLYESDFKS
jgi:DNA invertase Pin-like site-specific DNA recombinase